MKTTHVYVNDREHEALERLAGEYGLSESGVLRLGLRAIAGLTIPSRFRDPIREALDDDEERSGAAAIAS